MLIVQVPGKCSRAHVAAWFAALALAACGGGGGTGSAEPTPGNPAPAPSPAAAPAPPPAIAGDPPFSSSCGAAPSRASIGPFTTQPGDCFVSIQITAQELIDFRSAFATASVRTRVLDAVAANFVASIDSIVVLIDESSAEQGSLPYGINYPVQTCSVHNTSCPRFGRLGNVWLTARNYISAGPSLHELLHGYHVGMAADSTANYIIPTTEAAHWGFSSAGGQHGGWAQGSLVALGGGAYKARGPAVVAPFVQPSGFGTFANGGNSVPYSNLELWTMGLIPDAELQAIDVAKDAVSTGAGQFTASAIVNYTPGQIVARVLPAGRPSTNTPRAFRSLVVLASTSAAVSAQTVAALNADIEQFTQRSPPTALNFGYNFWTATGYRSTLQMAAASGLAK